MRYIEAPETYQRGGDAVTVFLAGGITGCPDWQAEIITHLRYTDLVLFNPRRANFPIDDPNASYNQIFWEYHHLRRADRILFWFPAKNQAGCPIALFELGAWLKTDKPLAIGVEPGYVREQDVRIQTALERPSALVVSTLEDLAKEIQ